ncbi:MULTISPECIES: methylenetetrahydrofolate reductase [NAD(P)H] [unclassified Lentimicrobium]|uniref:methylenetetrahydrofolate reductase [NAD(P)H] n=1 Tax=unclassified Lentimicrobium TaxID=2677434 RepID=UPI0015526022|nr:MULTISPECIES: methylenetetrahydrofolate reductase [NAD(P)H] [unclassified Lentimicrobium]NPD46970.1 methylenetetrahydrofolate reductase [NAD(P)H] [Lentimicrobium sp. S6]NPD84736.1 methylenetetrahydrofolate reductase [NAD(P)H] [Lentimicrobium sp. L6]
MKVIDHINKSDKTLFSFELLPPLKGEHFEHIEGKINQLLEFNPSYINITYHQQEVEYETLSNGLLKKRTVRKRPGTVGISAAIQYKTQIDVVPHLICGGFTKEDTENALIDLHFLGIDNLLLLRGDPPATQKFFKPEPEGNAYAVDLVKQVKNMNNGIYLDENLMNNHPSDFCIGVAGYPEKHPEAANRPSDLRYLKDKVDAGADYIITQMFFDNKKFFRFVEQCRAAGITVPIIPGLKPFSSKKQLLTLPQIFHIDLPDQLVNSLVKCKTNAEVYEVGIEWGIQQSKELIEYGIPALHFYTMGKADNICRIAKEIF